MMRIRLPSSKVIMKLWASLGVYWFMTFSMLSLAKNADPALTALAALSLFVGFVVAILSVVSAGTFLLALLLHKGRNLGARAEGLRRFAAQAVAPQGYTRKEVIE